MVLKVNPLFEDSLVELEWADVTATSKELVSVLELECVIILPSVKEDATSFVLKISFVKVSVLLSILPIVGVETFRDHNRNLIFFCNWDKSIT